jgi:hypothetical protein
MERSKMRNFVYIKNPSSIFFLIQGVKHSLIRPTTHDKVWTYYGQELIQG